MNKLPCCMAPRHPHMPTAQSVQPYWARTDISCALYPSQGRPASTPLTALQAWLYRHGVAQAQADLARAYGLSLQQQLC
jgi:hypothetical protein